ncbi:MAG: DUF481 domain-containing protein [Bdellovibrionales bacterium]
MIKFILAAVVLASSGFLVAQETEATKAEKNWSTDIELKATEFTGNSKFRLIGLSSTTAWKFDSHTLSIIVAGENREDVSERFDIFSFAIHDDYAIGSLPAKQTPWAAFADLKYLRDTNRGIKQGNESAIGVGYNFWGPYKSEKDSLVLSFGLGYLDQQNTDDTNTHFGFVAGKVDYTNVLDNKATIKVSYSYNANVNDTEDYVSQASAGIENPLGDGNSIAVRYVQDIDSTPVGTNVKADSKTEILYKHSL